MEELTTTRKILHGIGAYLAAMFIMSAISTVGAALASFLLSVGEPGSAAVMVLGSIAAAFYAANEFRKRRAYESTKTWVIVAMAIFGAQFVNGFFF